MSLKRAKLEGKGNTKVGTNDLLRKNACGDRACSVIKLSYIRCACRLD